MTSLRFFVAISAMLLPLAAHGAPLTGFSLNSASFAGGSISYVHDLEWKLERTGRPTEELYLAGRDDTSVYLCDKEKEYNMQIDYTAGKIMVNSYKRFDITKASRGPVNVRNLGGLQYEHGNFEQVAFKKWMWKNRLSGTSDPLLESGRDESSVFLTSMDGALRIQLDFSRKVMTFSADVGTWYAAFPVKNARYSKIAYRLRC